MLSLTNSVGEVMKQFISYFFKSLAGKVAGVVFVAILLAGGWFVLQHFNTNLFGFSFGREPKIDNTANVVEKIKSISEFTTACYYEEAVLKNSKNEAGEQNALMNLVHIKADSVHSEVVILAKGKVRAGYDLGKISADQIRISGDSISVALPEPEIFDVIVNPSDYEMYIEEGKWNHEEISAIQAGYRNALTEKSKENGLLEKADDAGKTRLATLFKVLGFSYVELK